MIRASGAANPKQSQHLANTHLVAPYINKCDKQREASCQRDNSWEESTFKSGGAMMRDAASIKREAQGDKCNMTSTENKAKTQAQQDKRLEEEESDSLMRVTTHPAGSPLTWPNDILS